MVKDKTRATQDKPGVYRVPGEQTTRTGDRRAELYVRAGPATSEAGWKQ